MALAWQDARRRASELLEQYWDGTYPVDVRAIARAAGLDTYIRELPSGVSGLIVKREDDERARAYASAFEIPERQRFTFAHELGHFIERTDLAHDPEFSFTEKRSREYNLHEFYADEFAGALLMPARKLEKLENEGKTLTEQAQILGVSVAAVKKRHERLNKAPEQ